MVRDTASVLRLRGPRKFALVIMPSAAPFIATGLRVAVAVALIVDIVAELIGGSGVGERILLAENAGPSAYPDMYAYIVVAGVLGVLLAGAFTVGERHVLHWHESQRSAAGERQFHPERTEVTLAVSLSPGRRPGAHPGVAVRGAVRRVVGVVGRF